MAENLRIFTEENETIISKKPAYQTKVNELAARLVEDPRQYVRVASILTTVAEAEGEKSYGALQPASARIFQDISATMKENHRELSTDRIGQWLSLADELPSTLTYDAQEKCWSSGDQTTEINAETAARIEGIHIGSEIITNSLVATAEKAQSPEEIIDALHAVGRMGISLDNAIKTQVTTGIIKETLERSANADYTLRAAPLSKMAEKYLMKSIDLVLALQYFDQSLGVYKPRNEDLSFTDPSFGQLWANKRNQFARRAYMADMIYKITTSADNGTILKSIVNRKHSFKKILQTGRQGARSFIEVAA